MITRFRGLRDSPPDWLRVLNASDSFSSPVGRVVSIAILLAWLTVVVLQSAHHEVWRDEMRALSVAQESQSIWQFPQSLSNEGHPLLWYAMLRVAHASQWDEDRRSAAVATS